MHRYAGSTPRFERLSHWELNWCLRFNRAGSRCEYLFAVVSRLGDGGFWYALMVCLLVVDGFEAAPAVAHMLATGGLCLLVYKWLKAKTVRPRPCNANRQIRAAVAPLDLYSFPSGHTLHAVGFSSAAIVYYPGLIWLVLPFTVLVALSRVVLGLHYPSDVAAGAVLGATLAGLVLQI